jgi:hypothetical protein
VTNLRLAARSFEACAVAWIRDDDARDERLLLCGISVDSRVAHAHPRVFVWGGMGLCMCARLFCLLLWAGSKRTELNVYQSKYRDVHVGGVWLDCLKCRHASGHCHPTKSEAEGRRRMDANTLQSKQPQLGSQESELGGKVSKLLRNALDVVPVAWRSIRALRLVLPMNRSCVVARPRCSCTARACQAGERLGTRCCCRASFAQVRDAGCRRKLWCGALTEAMRKLCGSYRCRRKLCSLQTEAIVLACGAWPAGAHVAVGRDEGTGAAVAARGTAAAVWM